MRQFDVAVVGGGPAGIAAASAAAASGVNTLLVDEHAKIGGQLRWRISLTIQETGGLDVGPGPGPYVSKMLASALNETDNLTVETGTVAWGLFEDNVLGLASDSSAEEVQSSAIILATGSTDITLPFPGWTLPGVMTDRAARIFMHIHRVLPGSRWEILGTGEESDELAVDLERAGAEVVARCNDPEQIRASGTNRLAHIEIGEDVYEADALAVALGRQPDAELALQAKATSTFVPDLGGFIVHRDKNGQTSEPGLYVAGDAAGIGSLAELVAEGRLAGLAASGAGDSALEEARAQVARVSSTRRANAIARLRLNEAAV